MLLFSQSESGEGRLGPSRGEGELLFRWREGLGYCELFCFRWRDGRGRVVVSMGRRSRESCCFDGEKVEGELLFRWREGLGVSSVDGEIERDWESERRSERDWYIARGKSECWQIVVRCSALYCGFGFKLFLASSVQ